jgi:hypothetical protein
MAVLKIIAKPLDAAHIKKYGLRSKYQLPTVPITIAINIPRVLIVDVRANNQLQRFFWIDSITRRLVTGFLATMKNPSIGDIA